MSYPYKIVVLHPETRRRNNCVLYINIRYGINLVLIRVEKLLIKKKTYNVKHSNCYQFIYFSLSSSLLFLSLIHFLSAFLSYLLFHYWNTWMWKKQS